MNVVAAVGLLLRATRTSTLIQRKETGRTLTPSEKGCLGLSFRKTCHDSASTKVIGISFVPTIACSAQVTLHESQL